MFPVYGECIQWSAILLHMTAITYQEQDPAHDVKIDPGAQVNTIALSKYQKFFLHKISNSRYPKPSSLSPTAHTGCHMMDHQSPS